jgi:hypothetical protein
MGYKDALNKEDYRIVSIFEYTDHDFTCNLCGEIFSKDFMYKNAKGRCKECHKFERKLHHYKDPEYARNQNRTHQKENRTEKNKYYVERRKIDKKFKLRQYLSSRLVIALKSKSLRKNSKFYKVIGCDLETLKKHIESQFMPGMNWENWGAHGWHVDHILPLSSGKTTEEIESLSHYTNLQPLWAKDNLAKGNRIIKKAA